MLRIPTYRLLSRRLLHTLAPFVDDSYKSIPFVEDLPHFDPFCGGSSAYSFLLNMTIHIWIPFVALPHPSSPFPFPPGGRGVISFCGGFLHIDAFCGDTSPSLAPPAAGGLGGKGKGGRIVGRATKGINVWKMSYKRNQYVEDPPQAESTCGGSSTTGINT